MSHATAGYLLLESSLARKMGASDLRAVMAAGLGLSGGDTSTSTST